MQYCTSDFKTFIYDDLATSCKHLVNFGPVTSEFKRVKCVHPSSISSLATFALLLDLAGSLLSFRQSLPNKAGLICPSVNVHLRPQKFLRFQ